MNPDFMQGYQAMYGAPQHPAMPAQAGGFAPPTGGMPPGFTPPQGGFGGRPMGPPPGMPMGGRPPMGPGARPAPGVGMRPDDEPRPQFTPRRPPAGG